MLLSRDDAELFFRLHRSLMHFVNQRLGVVPAVGSPEEFAALPLERRLDVRRAFLDRPDLILSGYNISFGGGIKRMLNDSYRQAKERLGIVTTLPAESARMQVATTTKPRKRQPKRNASGSKDVNEILQYIVGMTDDFCHQHLNEEYATLCRKLAAKLSRNVRYAPRELQEIAFEKGLVPYIPADREPGSERDDDHDEVSSTAQTYSTRGSPARRAAKSVGKRG